MTNEELRRLSMSFNEVLSDLHEKTFQLDEKTTQILRKQDENYAFFTDKIERLDVQIKWIMAQKEEVKPSIEKSQISLDLKAIHEVLLSRLSKAEKELLRIGKENLEDLLAMKHEVTENYRYFDDKITFILAELQKKRTV